MNQENLLNTKTKVGVYGASGYAGLDLIDILAAHPCVDVIFATSDTYADDPVLGTDLTYIPHAEAPLADADAIFLALPHGASASMAKQALDKGVKVVDLSADMRLDSSEAYQQWYKLEHPYPDLLTAPYGLPEINRENIHRVAAVAVPGCYPTTTLLGLYPLLKSGALLDDAPIIVDAKSGVTGAGRSPKPHLHFPEVYGNFSPYAPGRSHRHVGEIEQEIHKLASNVGPLIFTPHLLPVDRGLMASIYVTLNNSLQSEDAQALYESTYADEPMVNVLPAGQQATLKHAVKQNTATISLTPVTPTYLHITSVTDNLRKGAAGQAVQDFNLMFGFEETTGLL